MILTSTAVPTGTAPSPMPDTAMPTTMRRRPPGRCVSVASMTPIRTRSTESESATPTTRPYTRAKAAAWSGSRPGVVERPVTSWDTPWTTHTAPLASQLLNATSAASPTA